MAGNATFAPPLKTPGDRKMRRKNWMTSRAENVGSSLEEEKTVNGREGEAEAAEAAEAEEAGGGGERKPVGEAIVKELSEEGLAHPPDGDEGYAEDEGCVQDEEQDTDHPPDQLVSDQTSTKEDLAPVPVVEGECDKSEGESGNPKPKPPSLSGRIWKKLGFGAAAVAPKKAKMTDPPEPETVEEVMEEEEVDDGDGEEAGSVAIQMEVVSRAEEDIPEMATEESDLGDLQQQPRRSLEMIS